MSTLRLPAFGELADNSWSLSQKKINFWGRGSRPCKRLYVLVAEPKPGLQD